MATYRWNKAEFARGYDAAASAIHPHYEELQRALLDLLPQRADEAFLLVDAGGGSGRLAALFLARFPRASVIVVDQSEAFLAIAEERLRAFSGRGTTHLSRLQDDWRAALPEVPGAVVSMSAIHHLDPAEKQALYQRLYDMLTPGGVLLNGDEIRPEDDAVYLAEMTAWSLHMRQMQDAGRIPAEMDSILDTWRETNIVRHGQPKISGDDCHETLAKQLGYLRAAGFSRVDAPWQQRLWAVLRGRK